MNTLQKELQQDFENGYKKLMKELYLKWHGKMNSNAIRECFTYYVVQHNHTKVMELIRGRNKRKIIMQNLKEKNRVIEYKIIEDNLAKEIGEMI